MYRQTLQILNKNLYFLDLSSMDFYILSILLSVQCRTYDEVVYMKNKLLTIRIDPDFHQEVSDYCQQRFLSVSSLVLQLLAKEVNYRPRPSVLNRTVSTSPVRSSVVPQAVEPEYGELPLEDYRTTDDDATDLDWEDLQRRAAAAPLRPVG